MALPPGWIIYQPNTNSRFFYRNEKEKTDVWIRPSPPPGYEGRWPLIIRASHILVKSIESRPPAPGMAPISKNVNSAGKRIERSKNKAYAKIKKIRDDIISKAKTFKELAFYQSDCSSSRNYGDLGWFDPTTFAPEFVKVVMNLKYGELSEPFTTDSGWHIAMRTDGCVQNPTVSSGGSMQMSILDAPPFEIEFQTPRNQQITGKRKSDIYRDIYETETSKSEEQWKKVLNDLMEVHASPLILYQYLCGYLFYHPTNSKTIDYCADIVQKFIPEKMDEFSNKVLIYTCNPRYWKQFCPNKETIFRKVGFTFNYAQEWINYAKGFSTNPQVCCQILIKALTSLIVITDDLLKFAQDKAGSQCPEASRLEERVSQIYINRILDVIQKNPLYNTNFEEYIDKIINALQGETNETSDIAAKIQQVVYAPEKITSLLNFIKENKKEVEKRKNFERDRTNTRSDISRNLFTDASQRTMIVSTDQPKYRRWMDYLDHEKQINLIIDDPEFYIDCIDFSYRLALTELWWIPSVWMHYWEFLDKNGREEDAGNVLALAQNTFQNNASFELERADIFLRDGKFDEARSIYSSLMERGEPLLTSAMTLDFRCVIMQKGESEALQTLTDRVNFISPAFIINTAKMCSNSEIAWSLYQLGMDKFSTNLDLKLAAADFLAQQRDINNTRLILQQTKQFQPKEQLILTKRLFEFELEHIAPPDHLNETQKTFKDVTDNQSPFIQYMHRYRFKDLYPLDTEELITTAYCTTEFSIDYPKVSEEFVTLLPPSGVSLDKMRTRKEYGAVYDRALERFSNQTQKMKATDPTSDVPPLLSDLEHKVNGIMIPVIINVDEVIEEIKKITFTTY